MLRVISMVTRYRVRAMVATYDRWRSAPWVSTTTYEILARASKWWLRKCQTQQLAFP
jgi:hypothetical protein